jgi:uncharacterized delta-60 repeat protein
MRILELAVRNSRTRGRSLAAVLCSSATILPMLLVVSTAAGGGLDPGFGDGGLVITNLSGSDFSFAIATQPDGKIVSAGTSNYGFALVRYNSDGTLDRTFGVAGTILKYFGPYNLAYGVAIQTDGKIVAAGYQQNAVAAGPGFSVAPVVSRYNADGSPDTGFGVQGIATVGQAPVESAKSLAIQQDGKIVVAGNRLAPTGIMRGPSQFALSRLNPDGSLDLSFGASGEVTTSFDQVDFLNSILIQPDGKIVAVGDSGAADAGQMDSSETTGRSIAIARYNADGSLDPGFGTAGRVLTRAADGAVAYGSALQPDGKLIVTGSSGSHLMLARYNPDGSPDRAFGSAGLISSLQGEGYSVLVQSDGNILVGGSASGAANDQFGILRFNADGSPDMGFGSGGIALMDVGLSATGRALAVEPSGRIIMTGYVQKNADSVQGTRFALLAYLPSSSTRCIRAAGDGDYVIFNPDGRYTFALCGNREMKLSGTGSVSVDGSTITVVDRQPDRAVKIAFDTNTATGKAKIKMVMPEGVVPFTIRSSSPNAVCSCAAW